MATTIAETRDTRTPTQPYPEVSIIIVNYNGKPHLDECLGALTQQHYPAYQLLLVDNASTDDSLDLVRRNFPEVQIITSDQNLGYSGAVNFALPHATGAYVVVLNMDAMVEVDWLRPLVAFMEAHPEVGAVTPKILLYDDPTRINALGQNIHVSALGFNRALNRPDMPNQQQPFQVSGLHGAAFLMRKDVLERMGGMNEACFLYHEDVDLSWLINLMGYDIYCVPESVVRHKYALGMYPQKLYYLERNRMAMLLANIRWPALLALTPFLAMTEAMMTAYCLRRGKGFIQAKARAVAWLWERRRQIRARRQYVTALRRRSDWEMIRRLRLGYEWDQLLKLGR
jgi:hypothetical protein